MTNDHGQHNIDTTYDGFDSECATCRAEVPDITTAELEIFRRSPDDRLIDLVGRYAYATRQYRRVRFVIEADVEWREDDPEYCLGVARLASINDDRIEGGRVLTADYVSDPHTRPNYWLGELAAQRGLTAQRGLRTPTLDLTGRTYIGPLPLAPCGPITVEHDPHTHTQRSGDMACAGTRQPCTFVQRIGGQTWPMAWWLR